MVSNVTLEKVRVVVRQILISYQTMRYDLCTVVSLVLVLGLSTSPAGGFGDASAHPGLDASDFTNGIATVRHPSSCWSLEEEERP